MLSETNPIQTGLHKQGESPQTNENSSVKVQVHMDPGASVKSQDLKPSPNPFPPPSMLWLCCAVHLHSPAGSFHGIPGLHPPSEEAFAGENSTKSSLFISH